MVVRAHGAGYVRSIGGASYSYSHKVTPPPPTFHYTCKCMVDKLVDIEPTMASAGSGML